MALGCLVYTISSRSRMRVPSDPDAAAALRIAWDPSLTQVSERFRPKKRERPRQLKPPGPSEALERNTGFEPATFALAIRNVRIHRPSRRSTPRPTLQFVSGPYHNALHEFPTPQRSNTNLWV